MHASRVAVLAAGLAAGLVACPSSPDVVVHVRSNGALAVSNDDARLFAVDADNDHLVVIDAARLSDPSLRAHAVLGRVPVGRWPERVAVGNDGLVYATNRFDRSVSVVDPEALEEVARIEVGFEPIGLAFSPDGRTLLVANSMSHSVSIVDVESRSVAGTLALADAPRGVAFVGADRAWVTHARTGEVSSIRLSDRFVSRLSIVVPAEKLGPEQRVPSQPVDPIVSPDDERVYVPHVQVTDSPVPTDVEGGYAGFGQLPVVADAIATLDRTRDRLLDAPAIASGMACTSFLCETFDGPSRRGRRDVPALMTASHGAASAGVTAGVVDAEGRWLFLVNRQSRSVVMLSARGEGLYGPGVRVGRGPGGIALSADGSRAWVYNAFSHSVSVLEGRDGMISVSAEVRVGSSPLPIEQQLGRDLFFAADDPRMSDTSFGGISCASCHPDGRDDGRTWLFDEGPRNTPTLAGVQLLDTAPWHWDGLFSQVHEMAGVIEQRMGGSGTRGSVTGEPALREADFRAIFAYLDSLPGYDNPHRQGIPPADVEDGRALFEGKANCSGCHTGPLLTDNQLHDPAALGTLVPADGQGSPDRLPLGVNTPSLRHLFATAPYMHHGAAADLRSELIFRHGGRIDLTATEVEQLVAFLKTL